MVFKVTRSTKLFFTFITNKGFQSTVFHFMLFKVKSSTKQFLTFITVLGGGQFSSMNMNDLVSHQIYAFVINASGH